MVRSDSDAITSSLSGSPLQAISQGAQGFPQTMGLESDLGQILCLGTAVQPRTVMRLQSVVTQNATGLHNPTRHE